VSFAVINLSVASQQVYIIIVVYFVSDSVRKLLDTASYYELPSTESHDPLRVVSRTFCHQQGINMLGQALRNRNPPNEQH